LIWLKLSAVFSRIGLFTIGGGYALLPLIQREVVSRGWLTNNEYADILAISEVTPGPLSINTATFVGYRIAGIPGALLATFSLVLPSFIIVLLLGRVIARYRDDERVLRVFAGVRPAVAGTIGAAAVVLGRTILFPTGPPQWLSIDWKFIIITGFTVVSLSRKLHPIIGLILAGIAGLLLY
jgi:chromate transporter